MQLTETIKLYPNQYISDVKTAMQTYIQSVNKTVAYALAGNSIKKFGSGDIHTDLPSAVRNQVCRDARTVLNKYYKDCHKAVLHNRKESKRAGKIIKGKSYKPNFKAVRVSVLKQQCCFWNNQNFKIAEDAVFEFPLMINGKTTRAKVPTSMTKRQWNLFSNHKLGTMRIVFKTSKLVAQITYNVSDTEPAAGQSMGIDLGLKCPVVAYTNDGKIKFFGNGRKNKYLKRFYRYQRKKLQKLRHHDAVKKLNCKEQRIMQYEDHKISKRVIQYAVKNNVSTIKMEQLQNIRSTARTSRKNNHSLHTWSFYRLQKCIAYKAALAGIKVIYVNPKYTSQTCPICGKRNHANDRTYRCSCGFHMHRDIVGAVNIDNSTDYAKTA